LVVANLNSIADNAKVITG